jgi:hypothetical protein
MPALLKISSLSFVLKISSLMLMLLRCQLRAEDFQPSADVDDTPAFVL